MDQNSFFKRAQKVIPSGVNSPVRAFRAVGENPLFIRGGNGCFLMTTEGERFIDYIGTWGAAIHGHNHSVIKEAITEALEEGISFGLSSPSELEMAERIVELVPSIEKVRMVNSGTEAVMSAIRVARGYTGRSKIVKFAGCYHGHSDCLLVNAGSGALTFGSPDSTGVPASLIRDTLVLPFNDPKKVEAIFEEFGSDIAAIILEPYPANVGLILPEKGYLQFLREICTKWGSVLIFDEVITGFRVSLRGAQEHCGVIPDMTTLGKIIGAGMPVGAFGGRMDLMDCLSPEGSVYQAGTLSGNPIAMAAGLASLKMLQENFPYSDLERKACQIKTSLLAEAEKMGVPLQVPQVGSMFGFYFSENPVRNDVQAKASDTVRFKKFFQYARKRGVLLPPSPFETCFIGRAHDDQVIEETIEILLGGLREVF